MQHRTLLSVTIALLLALPAASCTQSSEDTDDLLGLSLLAGAVASTSSVAQLEGHCHVTFGSRTVYNVPITAMDSATSGTVRFASSTTRNWTAVAVPATQNGTVVSFDFNPAYRPPFGYNDDISLLFVTTACPITSSTPTDYNVNSSLTAAQTPAYYTFANNAFTFNSAAQDQNFYIVAAPELTVTTGTVTRTNP